MTIRPAVPWYREPWPWILIAGPAVVVAAATWTAVIAVRSDDGLVTEDYYRQGLAINRELARERHAGELGVVARLGFGDGVVRVELPAAVPAAAALELKLAHPARGKYDETIEMKPVGNNTYEGGVRMAPQGVSRIVLQDRERTWRLDGAMRDAPRLLTLGTERP
ncbi:MAG TPA: FixH family protein [Usitatibacter sp.]|nr:FixH family protein [Usitatibacter sp.]